MNSIETANQILDIFEKFRMSPTPIDEYEKVGKDILRDRILTFINANKSIEFVMLGFPMKSPNNRDKVLGKLPDLAEEVTFQNFSRFDSQIKAVYKPGVNIDLVSDGLVFSDVLDVADSIVNDYVEASKDMSSLSPVRWFDLTNFYSCAKTNPAMREKLVSNFGITPEELERRIQFDPDVNYLYRGMIKFMEGDLAIRIFPSGNQLHKAAKRIAREMMMRNEAYSALIRSEFKNHIRLSMHDSVNNGNKYSFQLIPSPKAWTSPWHCVLLIDEVNEYATIHRKDAEAKGYRLVYKEGRPYNFQAA